jgi:hypothetical protein
MLLRRKEFQRPFNKRFVILENAPVPGVLIEDEARRSDRVAAGRILRNQVKV